MGAITSAGLPSLSSDHADPHQQAAIDLAERVAKKELADRVAAQRCAGGAGRPHLSGLTWAGYCDSYANSFGTSPNRRENDCITRFLRAAKVLERCCQLRLLSDLTPETFDQLETFMIEAGVTPQARMWEQCYLRTGINWAFDQGWLDPKRFAVVTVDGKYEWPRQSRTTQSSVVIKSAQARGGGNSTATEAAVGILSLLSDPKQLRYLSMRINRLSAADRRAIDKAIHTIAVAISGEPDEAATTSDERLAA